MAYRELGMWEVQDVLRRVQRGETKSGIERATGRSRKTIHRYVKTASSSSPSSGHPRQRRVLVDGPPLRGHRPDLLETPPPSDPTASARARDRRRGLRSGEDRARSAPASPEGVPRCSDPLDERLREERGIEPIAPHRTRRMGARTQDGRSLRRVARRWKVERLFAWLLSFRRLTNRWEHYEANFLGFVQLGCACILLRHF